MPRTVLLLVLLAPLLPGCNGKSARSKPGFAADIHIVAPFVTDRPNTDGKLYMSKGRLRVELGPMVDVYIIDQKKGWRMFSDSRQYFDIGERRVSTYLPRMTNGSPCPAAEFPSSCKLVGKENIEGRSATKWELVNQHSENIYLWTDDKLEVAVRWHIENVTYDLTGIHEVFIPESMFELPPGYSKTDMFNSSEDLPSR
jgi:hypothetical protein